MKNISSSLFALVSISLFTATVAFADDKGCGKCPAQKDGEVKKKEASTMMPVGDCGAEKAKGEKKAEDSKKV
jgi:hypothetical protein